MERSSLGACRPTLLPWLICRSGSMTPGLWRRCPTEEESLRKTRKRKIKINTHRELYWPDVKIQEMYEAAYLNEFWQLTSPLAVQCTRGLESRANAATSVNVLENCTHCLELLLTRNLLFIKQRIILRDLVQGYLLDSCCFFKAVKNEWRKG